MSSTQPLPLEAVLIRLLQLIQAFGLFTAPGRNWSSLFLNRMLPIFDFRLKLTRFPARSPLPIAALPSVSPIPSARLPI